MTLERNQRSVSQINMTKLIEIKHTNSISIEQKHLLGS